MHPSLLSTTVALTKKANTLGKGKNPLILPTMG